MDEKNKLNSQKENDFSEEPNLTVENIEQKNDSNLNETENIDTPKNTDNTNIFYKCGKGICKGFAVLGRWIKRMFMGGSKELSNSDKFAVEKIESPGKMMVKTFFSRKLAVVALCVLVSLFLFVFIGPAFMPMDLSYIDPLQKNVQPNFSFRSVPKKLKGQIDDISGYSLFTLGLGEDGKIYSWGDTKDKLLKINYDEVPDSIKDEKIIKMSAGFDHAIAISETGKVVGWGNNLNGQYGGEEVLGAIPMPDELVNGTIDVSQVKQLVCGNQASAIVMNDGTVKVWGNINNILNLEEISKLNDVDKIVFSSAYAIALLKDGTIQGGSFDSVVTKDGESDLFLDEYLKGRRVIDIEASDKSLAILLDQNELIMSGIFKNNEDKIPVLPEDEYFVDIKAGTGHFVGLTNKGRAFGWGLDNHGQADFSGVKGVTSIYAGALQTYLVDEDKDLIDSYGLSAYIMGTDSMGRDVFARIVHGGKMTMTIGAVAVIISTLIAIIIGCISGYFGGWIDMLLMRITEIFGAIPFLPFAMLLSAVISHYPVGETMRIFIIMVILGALSWTGLARMIRGQVLAEREKEFVTAAKAMGVKENKIAFKHILPNIISVILVSITLDFAGCLLTESSLSYLGFGVQQPQPTWGNMLNGANSSIVIQHYWWQWVFPALFLMTATICINIIGDTLRDVMDPKSSAER